MISSADELEEMIVTENEKDLILLMRSKFKGCDSCLEIVYSLIESLKKKDGK